MEKYKEECRDSWGVRVVTDLIRDIRYSGRSLWKSKVFTGVAVITLALGIGANTSVFSIANALMLRPLAVEDPSELKWLSWKGKVSQFSLEGWGNGDDTGLTTSSFPYPTFEAFREGVKGADVFGLYRFEDKTLRAGASAFSSSGLFVSDNFFGTLGVSPAFGNVFDDSSGEELQVVISHRLWRQAFGGDVGILKQSLTIEGRLYRVIGVLPPEFRGPITGYGADFYISFAVLPQVVKYLTLEEKDYWWMEIMLRLDGEDSLGEAASSLQSIYTRETDPMFLENADQPFRLTLHDGSSGMRNSYTSLGAPLKPLLGAVGVVLLIACSNLAGLMLVRGAAREHQAAVEGALGASRWRLMRRPLIESLLISFCGGALGLLIAVWGKALLTGLLWPGGLPVDFRSDTIVFGFSLLITIVAAFLFGLLPAWRISKINAGRSLKSRSAMGLPHLKFGRALVALQVGLSLTLLVVGGMFAQNLYRLSQVDTGFLEENLITFPVNVNGAGYKKDGRISFFEEMHSRISALPEVSGVTFASQLLISGSSNTGRVRLSDAEQSESVQMLRLFVRENFQETMGVSLMQGRELRVTDTDTSEKVVVISRSLAKDLFLEESAIGGLVRVGAIDYRVVGVCDDFKYDGLRENHPVILFSYRQFPRGSLVCYVRSSAKAKLLLPSIRKIVNSLDSNVAVPEVKSMPMVIQESTGGDRASAFGSIGFAGLAVVLCCVGLYGLMAYNVARRTGEIGVRMALGATGRSVTRALLLEAWWMTGAGIVGGLAVAWLSVLLLRSRLSEIDALDWRGYVAAVIVVAVVTLFAAWQPARRAARIEPIEALRAD